MGYIYKITNRLNNKIYIGQTRYTLAHRFSQHKNSFTSTDLHDDMRLYGSDNFSIEELEQCDNDQLNAREKYWVQYFDSYSNGYNMNRGGAGNYIGHTIYCYTLAGNLYKIYKDFAEAADDTGLDSSIIKSAIYNHNLSGGGYQWFFEEDKDQVKNLSDLQQNYGKISPLTVQYDVTGKYLATFITMQEAEKATGVLSSGIARCINGDTSHAGGFIWRRGFLGEKIPFEISVPTITENDLKKGRKRKVVCYQEQNQTVYNSLSEAARSTGFSRQSITRSCHIYPETRCGKVRFQFYEE